MFLRQLRNQYKNQFPLRQTIPICLLQQQEESEKKKKEEVNKAITASVTKLTVDSSSYEYRVREMVRSELKKEGVGKIF